ncbi:protein of unknown function [Methanocaldococcus lauensis]|uniref:Uncharacterized protein n=1 Tax=Methanocaldococcus lauensis TaxID=2546128 RepID=A0A8D6PPK3_9EURY|nr:protein of unknown function [Methanocaldococcus lauensis]CAB3289962.1 protein of unknown function [Methanocaldococcus lauensis]
MLKVYARDIGKILKTHGPKAVKIPDKKIKSKSIFSHLSL